MLQRLVLESLLVCGVLLLGLSDNAHKLIDRIDFWQGRGRLEEPSIVSLAPAV
jgi:hypothetical protein